MRFYDHPVPGVLTVLSVVGARPNIMKTAPVIAELQRRSDEFRSVLVHTGQHYDDAMSAIFFDELGVGAPDHMLGVGSGSHAQQTARVMERLEPVLEEVRPDIVLVPGDVNSTLAASITASKLGLRIGHIEAGLRSFDRTMPEEINRTLTDAISDLLFTHSPEALENLHKEGVAAERIHFVGNTMIDTLVRMEPRIDSLDVAGKLGLTHRAYLVVTLHRPALVDGPLLVDAVRALSQVAEVLPVAFPVHPRTRAAIERSGVSVDAGQLHLLEPIGYLEFLNLVKGSAAVLTDSGGIQEETTFLGIPCFTLRENTERPVTCSLGTNTLLGLDPRRIAEVPQMLGAGVGADREIPEGWDGQAAGRLVNVLARELPPVPQPAAH